MFPRNLEETLYLFGESGTAKLGGTSTNEIDVGILRRARGRRWMAGLKEPTSNVYGNGHALLYADVATRSRTTARPTWTRGPAATLWRWCSPSTRARGRVFPWSCRWKISRARTWKGSSRHAFMCSDAFHSQRLQEHASDPERTGVRVLRVRRLGRCWEPVILRHDIDFDPIAALAMAELESGEGVRSTYFVLLRTDFYNPLERGNVERLREIARLGHDIGLHYDETQYEDGDDAIAAIKREADTLGGALGLPVECVSMHRPSKASLEAQWSIPGIVNSYSNEFFQASNTLRTAGGGGASPFWT